MDDRPVNIYAAVAFDMHPKVRGIIDELNTSGQIDLDEHGDPYLIGVDKIGQNTRVSIVRNGRRENILFNTRRRADPQRSWAEDQWKRPSSKPIQVVAPSADERRRERGKRPMESIEAFNRIVENILS